jgi:hypothetical protein
LLGYLGWPRTQTHLSSASLVFDYRSAPPCSALFFLLILDHFSVLDTRVWDRNLWPVFATYIFYYFVACLHFLCFLDEHYLIMLLNYLLILYALLLQGCNCYKMLGFGSAGG